MPQENAQEQNPTISPDEVQYFVIGPDNEVYLNRENLPADAIQKFKRFSEAAGWMPFRFAYDPRTRAFFVQDDQWKDGIDSGDHSTWELANKAMQYVAEAYGIHTSEMRWRYGEPPNTAELRKLSQYGIAWAYIREYIHKEFGAEPLDLPIVEFVPGHEEEVPEQPAWFSPSGGTRADVSVSEPAIFINRKSTETDYGHINQMLILIYLQNFEEITKSAPDFQKKMEMVGKWMEHMNSGSYEQYFAIIGQGGTQVFKANNQQKNRIMDEESLRNDPSLKGYKGPLILFSYLPVRNQLIFQNFHPEDMKKYPAYNQMLEDIKRKVTKAKGLTEDKLVLTYDDTMNSPFVTTISKYTMLWDYISKVLAPRAGIQPQDITVVEAPLSQSGSTRAMFVRDSEEEAEKLPEERNHRISYGITVPYPFIGVESRIRNLGEKYHALLHEYAHYVQKLKELPHIAYSFQGSISDAKSEEERNRRFIEYINNPLEQDAHLNQMVYMLRMGMQPREVLDFLAPKTSLLHRAEYRKILDQAMSIFQKEVGERQQFQEQQQPNQRTASLWQKTPGVNDWWYIGSLEQLTDTAHQNDKQDEVSTVQQEPYNLRKSKQPMVAQGPRSTEGLLEKKRDPEMGYMKSVEQLLRESQI